MAKKNTSKAAHQPKNVKKTAPNAKLITTEQDIPELEPAIETVMVNDQPEMESVKEVIEMTTPSEIVEIVKELVADGNFDPNQPIEVFFELGDAEPEEAVEEPTIEHTEPTEVSTLVTETLTQPHKARKTKLGTDQTAKLAGCSYHFFRKYFKKRYAEEGIKVRFVKEEKGYNGHMEVAESDIEKAKGIILKIKAENADVKNLFWFV
jgi:hypothetical protein